jgi:hypothetical protein
VWLRRLAIRGGIMLLCALVGFALIAWALALLIGIRFGDGVWGIVYKVAWAVGLIVLGGSVIIVPMYYVFEGTHGTMVRLPPEKKIPDSRRCPMCAKRIGVRAVCCPKCGTKVQPLLS